MGFLVNYNTNIILIFIIIHYRYSPPSKLKLGNSTWNMINMYMQIQRELQIQRAHRV